MAANIDQTPFVFGPGSCWGTLQQFMDGTTPGVPQPRKFDVQQDFSVTFDATTKSLMGSGMFPRAIGQSEGKVQIKIKVARFDSSLWQLRLGEPAGATSGNKQMADDEAYTISSGTVTVSKSTLWSQDYGVRYGDTGICLTAVSGSSPGVGQYSVASGVYTFNTSDNNRPVVISYEYANNNVVWTNRGAAGTWSATHVEALDACIKDSNGNIQLATTAGTTGSTAPTWETTVGQTTTDGSVTWTCLGAAGNWSANTPYVVNHCITDGNGNIEQVTTAGISGGVVPTFSSSAGGTTADGGGVQVIVLSHPQGSVALTSLRYQGIYGGRTVGVYIPNAVGSNLNIPTKQGDFAIPEMDFTAFADPSGRVAYLYLPN